MSRKGLLATILAMLMIAAACGTDDSTDTTAASAETGNTTAGMEETTTTAGMEETTTTAGMEETTTTAAVEPIDITVSLIPIVDFMPMYVGVNEGIFERHGLNVTLQELFSSPGLVSAVTSGASQISTTSASQAVTGISNGLPIKVVSGGSISPTEGNTEILVRPDSDIESFADLEGRTVNTVALQGLFHLGALAAVEAEGGDPTLVEAIPGQQPDLAALLDAGRVDAIVIQEPYLSEFITEYGFNSLGNPYGALDYAIPAGVWISSIEQTENEPEIMRRFRAAMIEAGEFSQDNPDVVRAAIPDAMDLTEEAANALVLPIFSGELSEESMTAMGTSMLNFEWLEYLPSIDQMLWQDPEG